jgi:kynurenine formamidase
MICPAAVIDISERAARDPDTMLTVDDILTWETRHGRIPQGAAVMMHSGYDRHVETPGIFLGTDMVGGLHFPGFSEEASIYLAEECDIAFAGVDTLSLDRGRSTDFEAHHALLGAGVWGIECLKNLRHIPPSGATVFIGVPKVEGGSGGPCRVIASWE